MMNKPSWKTYLRCPNTLDDFMTLPLLRSRPILNLQFFPRARLSVCHAQYGLLGNEMMYKSQYWSKCLSCKINRRTNFQLRR